MMKYLDRLIESLVSLGEDTNKIFILAFLVIATSALTTGVVSGVLNHFKYRGKVSSKILDQHLKVRESLTEQLAELASTSYDSVLDEETLSKKAIAFSTLYYRYFDYIPACVLDDLLCLVTCLQDKEHRLFGCSNEKILPLTDEERTALISKIGLYQNFRLYTCNVFNSQSPETNNRKQVAAIVCQTRKVLLSMHETFTMYHFKALIKKLRKDRTAGLL